MVAASDNRDLSNKEKEHTHTHTAQKEKKKQTKKTIIADNGCSCTKLLGVNSNEKTEATSHVSLTLSIVSTVIAWSTSCLEKFVLNFFLRSYACLTFAS